MLVKDARMISEATLLFIRQGKLHRPPFSYATQHSCVSLPGLLQSSVFLLGKQVW